ncbi:MAG: SOS response-associated peptidase, partial [Alphaproteobacteria bacterium]|nr:SOS response-associated peptidase [Alphaproteobacteria bacterium]MDX5416553.1 SOS response-associated peptidase [Alphaproteobacteria bacterium]MDX5493912.1 SOS response-associated peptidase [Alphaproteobacteria bacterium]
MCGRYAITLPPDAMRRLFEYPDEPDFPPRYNIAPTQPVPVVIREGGERRFMLVRWGLVPSWAKEMPQSLLINARAETIAEKPSFRGAFR